MIIKDKEIHLLQEHQEQLIILQEVIIKENISKEINIKIKKIIKKIIKKAQVKKMETWKKLNQDFLKNKVISYKLINNQKEKKVKNSSINSLKQLSSKKIEPINLHSEIKEKTRMLIYNKLQTNINSI